MTDFQGLEILRSGSANGSISLAIDELDGGTDLPSTSAARGMCLLAANECDEAVRALRSAIAHGDDSVVTALNLALAEDLTGDSEQSLRRMRDLANHVPYWDEVHVRIAERLRRAGDTIGAETAYLRVLDIDPRRVEALLALGALLLMRRDVAAARQLLLRCCGVAPDCAEAWHALGLALTGTGELLEAEAAFVKAQSLAPSVVEYALYRVGASLTRGTGNEELARLEAATADAPLDVVQLIARGVLLDRLGRRDEAIDIFEVATVLAPDTPALSIEMANTLMLTDRSVDAEAALSRAITLNPDRWILRNNRAVILMRLHRFEEAREELEALTTAYGDQAGILCNLSNTLTALGDQVGGVDAAHRAVAAAPGMHLAWRAKVNALAYRDGVGGAEMLEAATRASTTIRRREAPPILHKAPQGRRLRIGLLSPMLKTHPVGWLTIAGFEHLDPHAFEMICIAQPESGDPIARRFRAVASEWHVAERADHAVLAEQLRGLRLDIIIDLSGYGDHGLMAACGHRVAPVQIKWVGMQNHSSGLAEMDWFITDRWETPAGFECFYSERLLRLRDGYVCYSPPPYAPDVVPPPQARNGYVTFGCFNNLAKVTPAVIATWSDILSRLPNAVLVLKSHQLDDTRTKSNVITRFRVHGVEADRVELRGSSPHRELLEQYGDVDIVLDPFPYTGGLTTCEALWMGVPTVTMAGEIFAARHATSHLSNVGLEDWVATNRRGYVELAVRRASDTAGLVSLRAGLRSLTRASPLCDAPRFGRSLGDGLRTAWAGWIDTRAAAG